MKHVSSLYQNLLKTSPNAVVFKSIEGLGIPDSNLSSLRDIAAEVITSKDVSDDEKISTFLKKIDLTTNQRRRSEKATCGQADTNIWTDARKGRIQPQSIMRFIQKLTKY